MRVGFSLSLFLLFSKEHSEVETSVFLNKNREGAKEDWKNEVLDQKAKGRK